MISHANRRLVFATTLVVACAVVAACSSSDFLEPSVRQPAGRHATVLITHQDIGVPAYFRGWKSMLADAPPANLIVLNPNDGPGPAPDWAAEVDSAHAKGVRVIGYVLTDTTARPSSAVKADIDTYYSFYPDLDGIFIDEATSDCQRAQSYYLPIHDYIKASHPNATVVINPGTNVPSCYLSVADIVVTFENSFAAYQDSFPTENREWETPANAGRIWHIVHTASASQLPTALQLSRARNAGYVFVTSFTEMQNTYGALPTYFHSEADSVRAFNRGGTTALSRWRGSNDGTNEHYTLHFSHPFEYYRVYIDSDHSAATGYAVAGIGADYLIENDILYSHGAAGWNWNQIGGVSEVVTATSVNWTVPRSTIGETAYPNTASLSFEAETIGQPVENTGKYEHVYSPSTGTITGYFAENDASNVYYQANYTTAYAYKHVYIDTDTNAATGYAYGGIGADYMIENNQLYHHAGTGWNWTLVATISTTGGTTGIKTWTVPRATLGETATTGEVANLVFDGSDGTTDHAAPIYRHVYTR
ncbi:MAG TPA: spherulation-specific family 4 protein [Longimicrobium sp.]|nr:spherulation-specific family 4 protein [Longimicrobium sp.]